MPDERERVAVALLGDEVGQRGGAGRLERRRGETGEEGQHQQRADRDGEQHGEEQRGPGDVGHEHHGDAPVAVGEGGEHLADADEAGQRDGGDRRRPGGRAGALEHQDGEGEPPGPVAQQRDHVGEPEAPELPEAQRRQQRRRRAVGRTPRSSSAIGLTVRLPDGTAQGRSRSVV